MGKSGTTPYFSMVPLGLQLFLPRIGPARGGRLQDHGKAHKTVAANFSESFHRFLLSWRDAAFNLFLRSLQIAQRQFTPSANPRS
jgi:hypothetical protein